MSKTETKKFKIKEILSRDVETTQKEINPDSKFQDSDNKYDFLKKFAQRVENVLNRFNDITPEIQQLAHGKNIVIVHALNEDYIHLRGAIVHDVMSTMLTSSEQSIKLDYDGTPLDPSETSYSRILRCFRYSFDWPWLFKIDDIDFEIFNHKCNDVNYCQGIVFYLEDLEEKFIDANNKTRFGYLDYDKTKNYPRRTIGSVNIKNEKTHEQSEMLLTLSKTNLCPILEYKDGLFILPWEDIIALAMQSGIADTISLNLDLPGEDNA